MFFLKAVIYVLSGCNLQKSGSGNTQKHHKAILSRYKFPKFQFHGVIIFKWKPNNLHSLEVTSHFFGGPKTFMAFIGPLGQPPKVLWKFRHVERIRTESFFRLTWKLLGPKTKNLLRKARICVQ